MGYACDAKAWRDWQPGGSHQPQAKPFATDHSSILWSDLVEVADVGHDSIADNSGCKSSSIALRSVCPAAV
jgi:hypothetical protein